MPDAVKSTAVRVVGDERRAALDVFQRLLAIDAPDVSGTLDAASVLLAEALDASAATIYLCDAATGQLVVGGAHGAATESERCPSCATLERTFTTGAPHRTGTLLLAPLMIGRETRGVLCVVRAAGDAFGAGDLTFLQTTGLWVGMVLRRAELSEEVVSAVCRTSRLLDHDTDGILPRDLAHIARRLGA